MAFEAEIERLKAIKADLINNREADLLRIAFDLSGLLKLRIQTTGQNSNNQPFAPYTPFSRRDRTKKGYQVGFVDFTRTGQLWASVGPRSLGGTNEQATVVIESRTQRGQTIIAGAERKRGNILLLSAEEIQFAQAANKARVLQRLKL
jgi:hypothetical protein